MEADELSAAAGSVVIKKSERSLFLPRRATTAMEAGLDKRMIPWNGSFSDPSPGI